MSRLRADSLVNYSGSGTPNFKSGVTGAAVTFTGDVTAANGSFTGNVTIGGTLSYQDVTNIDSVGIITAQQGIQVSANGVTVSGVGTFNNPITVAGIATINGGGLDVTGVITATSYSGDGSSLSGVSPSVSGIASGAISNGQPVILQSDGTVAGVGTTGQSQEIGTTQYFREANVSEQKAIYDPSTNRILTVWQETADSNKGKANVGTVTGAGITYGPVVEFDSNNSSHFGLGYDSDNEKITVSYRAYNADDLTKVATISGDTVSFGSGTNMNVDAAYYNATYDTSNQKMVVCYNINSSGGAEVQVGTVTGTAVTFGSSVQIHNGNAQYLVSTFDSTNNKHIFAYSDAGDSYTGKCRVGNVSSDTITLGSVVEFAGADQGTQTNGITFDPDTNKVIIAYRDDDGSGEGKAVVGTVTGTAITFGSPVTFTTNTVLYCGIAYDTNAKRVVISYRNMDTSDRGEFVVGKVSDDTITFSSASVFETGQADLMNNLFDPDNKKVVITYEDVDNTNNDGAQIVITPDFVNENLTSSNFLGFSNAAYTDGQTATIQIAGAVDDAQSGLTTASVHYVQTDGTLSTSAGTPSVEAGLALSATEIAIKA